MLIRSLVASVFVSILAVIVAASGCATGTQDTLPSSGDGSSPPIDSTTDTDAPFSGCPSSQIKCGGKCVDPQTDNANCNGCGKACTSGDVCSNGKCGLVCTMGLTYCSGAPYDAGIVEDAASDGSGVVDASGDAVSASDATADASEHEAGAGGTPDGGVHDAGKEAGTADAGPRVPYCASLNNDPKNCGACGKACAANELCTAGECILRCPSGQTACPDNTGCAGPGECCSTMDCTSIIGEVCPAPGGTCACPTGSILCASLSTCIPEGTCCTDADCKVTGETCPTPAGTCACPPGETPCTNATTSLCIVTGTCCTDKDCTVTGETCSASGGSCACPTGDKVCPTSNACIASTACCTASDCSPLPSEVMTVSCSAGACGITACDPGYVNVNGTYADGCECKDDTAGKSCATVTSEGSIALGQTITVTGVLPITGEENWFEFAFPDYTASTFHAKISIAGDAGIVFNVYDPTCTLTALACLTEGGNATSRTVWEISETDTLLPNTEFPPVGSGGTVYVEVVRATGAPTCNNYTLTISD